MDGGAGCNVNYSCTRTPFCYKFYGCAWAVSVEVRRVARKGDTMFRWAGRLVAGFSGTSAAALAPAHRALALLRAPAPMLPLHRQLVSVSEARRKILGHHPPEGANSTPFKALHRLRRRGFIGPKVQDYYPEADYLEKHPMYRALHNQERLEELERNRKLGKSPPKKGAGKRAKK